MSSPVDISSQDSLLYLKCLAGKVATNQIKNVITLAGAGISTSAGIPDFRSPRTGLFFKSSDPKQQSADIVAWNKNYFSDRPDVLCTILKNNFLSNPFKPTLTHCFIRLLERKGVLLRHFTQNIDGLELMTGLPKEKVVEAHGSLHRAYCTKCRNRYDFKWLMNKLNDSIVPVCDACNGVVRPDIVLYGEALGQEYDLRSFIDIPRCDLLVILGTSQTVEPFASIAREVPSRCPRIVIRKFEGSDSQQIKVHSAIGTHSAIRNELPEGIELSLWGECDASVKELVRLIGWNSDFETIIEEVELKQYYGNIENFDVGVQASPSLKGNESEFGRGEGNRQKSTINIPSTGINQQSTKYMTSRLKGVSGKLPPETLNDRFCNYCYNHTCW